MYFDEKIVKMAEMLENKRFHRTQSKNAIEHITEDTTLEEIYKLWSVSDGIYVAISSSLQFRIRHKSFKVVVFIGLSFLNLSIVALEMRCLVINV